MAVIRILDPVTRLEGHLKIEVTIDTVQGKQQVVDAKATGTLFRGFETILQNRDPLDAPHITQRICGVCPVSHGMASVLALEAAANLQVPANARIMRNLVLGANFVQSHILHFYHLAALDYLDGPNLPPWQPTWNSDKRIDPATTAVLVDHYVTALEMRRKAHEMGALYGGKLPHPPAFIPGGVTTTPRPERARAFLALLDELTSFIQNIYLPDVLALAGIYQDYAAIGRGRGNLLAYGVFDLDAAGTSKLLRRGYTVNGSSGIQSLDVQAIREEVSNSWYGNSTDNLPPAGGATTPEYPKPDAYSWLKAPRYQAEPYEVGPLARMWVNGDYQSGVSVIHRHHARALEALKVAQAMRGWVQELSGTTSCVQWNEPYSGTGYGLTEAPRGALGHWVGLGNRRLAHYQVITPTCWNASPRDGRNVRGPMEEALIGTPIQDVDQPVEVTRVIHSFDPCLSCAVHVMRPAEGVKIFAVRTPAAGANG